MGSNASKMREEPWRNLNWNWNVKRDLLTEMKKFKPARADVKQLRILLYGPVGAGKSSFINSVSTVLRGTSAIPAPVNASHDETQSFTAEYKCHKIWSKELQKFFPIVLCDTMGLEPSNGIKEEDLILVMKGHVREDYKFNPISPLTDKDSKFYNLDPGLEDRVHLLVCVLPGDTSEIHPAVIQKIQKIRNEARDLNIPHVAVLTRTDLIHKEVRKNVRNVFKMQIVYDKIREYGAKMGFNENHIFPIRNYCAEYLEGNDDMDTLILTTLKHMLNYADDFIQTL